MPAKTPEQREAARVAHRLACQRYALKYPERIQAKRDAWKKKQPAYGAAYYRAHKEEILAKQRAYNESHREEAAIYNRAYRESHKEKLRLKNQAKYQANREIYRLKRRAKYEVNRAQILEKNRQYHESHPEVAQKAKQRYKLKNRDKLREQGRIYQAQRREANPEEMRRAAQIYNAENRTRIAQRIRAWRKRNPASSRSALLRYRARKLALPNHFTARDRQFMLQYWQYACAICGNQEGFWHTLADDHWIPLHSQKCPGTVPENILPLCHGREGCNNNKGKKDPHLWLIDRVGKLKAARILKAITTYFALVATR
jgi:hypothetical protein